MKTRSALTIEIFTCAVGALLVLLTGCGKADPPRFHANVVAMTLRDTPESQRKLIADAVEAMFGTPDEPFVLPETHLDADRVRRAAGPVWSNGEGSGRGLYRRHCGHCHGTTGDGMGPTAAILNPYPRDYRQGKFKFKSTDLGAKPTTDDLKRILRQGIFGTAMPTFDLLPSDEVDALVEYVKYLSMRGEVEIKLADLVKEEGYGVGDDPPSLPLDRETLVGTVLKKVVAGWESAEQKVVNPEAVAAESESRAEADLAASILHGRELFYSTAKCNSCHGPSALGDGQVVRDDWFKELFEKDESITTTVSNLRKRRLEIPEERGKVNGDSKLSAEEKQKKVKGLDDELSGIPEQISKLLADDEFLKANTLPWRTNPPRNLRVGMYRGGRRPLDLYRRIHTGIEGSGMPGSKDLLMGNAKDIWAIVDYVRSLQYEPISSPPPQKEKTKGVRNTY